MPQNRLRLAIHPGGYSLPNTLNCGQSFCWHEMQPGIWKGWVGEEPVLVEQEGDSLNITSILDQALSVQRVTDYFGVEDDLKAMLDTFPRDEWMQRSTAHSAGMRLLRQPPWECLAGFICSALKQVVQIQQIQMELRTLFGEPTPAGARFPTFERLARIEELELRQAKMGFRARHLHKTAQQLADGVVDLESVKKMDDAEALETLKRLGGVGDKVARCVLLFAYTRWTAFPLDVWMLRGLKQLYFPRKRKVTPAFLQDFATDYFGPYGGLAQQYLFHWLRSYGRNPLPR